MKINTIKFAFKMLTVNVKTAIASKQQQKKKKNLKKDIRMLVIYRL